MALLALPCSGACATETFRRPACTPVMLFLRARIAAALGGNEEAVRLIKQARKLGVWGQGELHLKSWFPQSLRDYPPFQEFVRPKG